MNEMPSSLAAVLSPAPSLVPKALVPGVSFDGPLSARRGRLQLEAHWPSEDVAPSPAAAAPMLRVCGVRRGQQLIRVAKEFACEHPCAARAVVAAAPAQVVQHPESLVELGAAGRANGTQH